MAESAFRINLLHDKPVLNRNMTDLITLPQFIYLRMEAGKKIYPDEIKLLLYPKLISGT